MPREQARVPEVEKDAVFASVGEGKFVWGRRRTILIIAASEEKNIPLAVREALVGLTISCMWGPEHTRKGGGDAPRGSCVAYVDDVTEALLEAGKKPAADTLQKATDERRRERKRTANEPMFIVFKKGEYRS